MTNSENNALTKECITSALFELMETNDYDKITINDIVDKAGFGRATFYRHFPTKDDVIQEYFSNQETFFQDIAAIKTGTEDDYYEIIFRVFSALKENKKEMQLVIKAHLEFMYLEYLNKALVENFKRNSYSDSYYSPYYFAGSLFNVSIQWLRNDCSDSIKHISDLYFNNLFVKL